MYIKRDVYYIKRDVFYIVNDDFELNSSTRHFSVIYLFGHEHAIN